MTFLSVDDLTPFAPDIPPAKAEAMIADAEAMAVLMAPCLTSEDAPLDPSKLAAVKAILRGAILRWNDAGSGAVTQQTAGPFSQTVDQSRVRRGMFWPSEIDQLQGLCSKTDGAFTVDTVPVRLDAHSLACDLRFGGRRCSCGADIAGYHLYGV